MVIKTQTTHVIENIEDKTGAGDTFAYQQVISHPCLILRVREGEFGWFAVEVGALKHGVLHKWRTSNVLHIEEDDDMLTIDTEDAVYTLRKLEDGPWCEVTFDIGKWNT